MVGILPIFNWISVGLYLGGLIAVIIIFAVKCDKLTSAPLHVEKCFNTKGFYCPIKLPKKKKCAKKKCKKNNKCNDDCDSGCGGGSCNSSKNCGGCNEQSECQSCNKPAVDCKCDDSSSDEEDDCRCGKKSCNKCCEKRIIYECKPPGNVNKGQLYIWPFIFIILILAVLYHLIVAFGTSKHSWYMKETMMIGNNPVRWLGYVLIAALIFPVIAVIIGLRNQYAILLLEAAVIGEAAFHLFAERTLVHARRPLYCPDWVMVVVAMVVGITAFILIWTALILAFIRQSNWCNKNCGSKAPTWVSVVFWTVFAVGVLYWVVLIVLAACPHSYFVWYEILFVVLGWIVILVFTIGTAVGLSFCTDRTRCWLPFLRRCEECVCPKKCN